MKVAVFWRRRGRGGALKGSGFTLGRVGEGRSGVSSSSSEYASVGSHLAFFCSPSAKMLRPPPAAEVRRGDRESEAMEMGEGSPIWTSIGDSTTVFDRQNGVRASRFGSFLVCEVGDSRETWL